MNMIKNLWDNKINKKVDKNGDFVPVHKRLWFTPFVLVCVIIFSEFIMK